MITAERLHGRIVDDLHRPTKDLGKVKTCPACSEIVGLGDGPVAGDWTRIADRNNLVSPAIRQFFNLRDHRFGSQFRSGSKLAAPARHTQLQFDVSTPDVDD